MTNIEQKAQQLLNEVRAEYPLVASEVVSNTALCRAIEQHEAFRQEVSDAVEEYFDCEQNGSRSMLEVAETRLRRFIITKPDPLVIEAREICARVCEGWIDIPKDRAAAYRAGSHDDEADFAYVYAALAKRGGRIVFDI